MSNDTNNSVVIPKFIYSMEAYYVPLPIRRLYLDIFITNNDNIDYYIESNLLWPYNGDGITITGPSAITCSSYPIYRNNNNLVRLKKMFTLDSTADLSQICNIEAAPPGTYRLNVTREVFLYKQEHRSDTDRDKAIINSCSNFTISNQLTVTPVGEVDTGCSCCIM
jgi:hypothetical protein